MSGERMESGSVVKKFVTALAVIAIGYLLYQHQTEIVDYAQQIIQKENSQKNNPVTTTPEQAQKACAQYEAGKAITATDTTFYDGSVAWNFFSDNETLVISVLGGPYVKPSDMPSINLLDPNDYRKIPEGVQKFYDSVKSVLPSETLTVYCQDHDRVVQENINGKKTRYPNDPLCKDKKITPDDYKITMDQLHIGTVDINDRTNYPLPIPQQCKQISATATHTRRPPSRTFTRYRVRR